MPFSSAWGSSQPQYIPKCILTLRKAFHILPTENTSTCSTCRTERLIIWQWDIFNHKATIYWRAIVNKATNCRTHEGFWYTIICLSYIRCQQFQTNQHSVSFHNCHVYRLTICWGKYKAISQAVLQALISYSTHIGLCKQKLDYYFQNKISNVLTIWNKAISIISLC